MNFKLLVTMSVASLALAGCSATVTTNTTANVANKTANAANTVANAAGNTVNAVSNANTTNSNSNSMAVVDGDTIRIDEAGIMMTVPKGFKHSKDGEDIIVKTEDEGVDIRFTVPKDGDYNKALVDAATEVDDYLKDVKIEDKGSKTTVNGMEATTMGGTATNEGEPVMWNLTVINAPKKPVLANIYAEKTSMEKHGPEVKKFLESVKKQ